MTDSFFVGGYWGARKEDGVQCANRLKSCLIELGARCDLFRHWYRKGKSPADAQSKPLDITSIDQMVALVEGGRRRTEIDNHLMDELGFLISLWNGETSERAASLTVTCGLFSNKPHLRNALVLDIPDQIALATPLGELSCLVEIVARVWEPEWGGLISRTFRNSFTCDPARPFVDRVLYVNRSVDGSRLPPRVTLKEVPGLGTLVTVQDEPLDAANPDHVRTVRAVAEALA